MCLTDVLLLLSLIGVLVGNACRAESIITVPMEEECGHDVSLISRIRYQARVTFTDADDGKTPWFPHLLHNCQVDVKGWYVWPRLMIYFEKFNLNCSDGHIALYDGKNEYNHVRGLPSAICGSVPSGVFTTESRILRIKYHVKSKIVKGDIFSLVVTAFQDGENCPSYAHECANGRCIDEEIRCNGHNSCGDGSDCRLTTAVIAGIVIGSLTGASLTLALVIACVCCLRPSKRQRRYEKRPVYQREVSTFTCDSEDGCVQPAVTSLNADPSGSPPADKNGTVVQESGDQTAARNQTNDSSRVETGKVQENGGELKTHVINENKAEDRGITTGDCVNVDGVGYPDIRGEAVLQNNDNQNETKNKIRFQDKNELSNQAVVQMGKTNGHAVRAGSTSDVGRTDTDSNQETRSTGVHESVDEHASELVNDQSFTQRL